MRLTTKGRFAVGAMIELALRCQKGPVALSTIGQRQRVSLSYLEQMFSRLRQQGLVESIRGPGGGYRLGRDADAISVADIVGAVEGDAPADAPGDLPGNSAMTDGLWQALQERIREHMQSITLASLVEEQRAKGLGTDDSEDSQIGKALKSPVYTQPRARPRVNAPNSVFALASFVKL